MTPEVKGQVAFVSLLAENTAEISVCVRARGQTGSHWVRLHLPSGLFLTRLVPGAMRVRH